MAQFAIHFNTRNNTTLQRDDVIKRVAAIVGDKHKVKLDDPELTIIIEGYQVWHPRRTQGGMACCV